MSRTRLPISGGCQFGIRSVAYSDRLPSWQTTIS
jgi:hypothetical protein